MSLLKFAKRKKSRREEERESKKRKKESRSRTGMQSVRDLTHDR